MVATNLFIFCEERTAATAFLEELTGEAFLSEFGMSTERFGSWMIPDGVPRIFENIPE